MMRSAKETHRIRGRNINRQLLFNLDIVWGDVNEDVSVPATDHAKSLIIKAIERTRKQRYTEKYKTK